MKSEEQLVNQLWDDVLRKEIEKDLSEDGIQAKNYFTALINKLNKLQSRSENKN